MARVLILRERLAAEDTARRIAALGHEPVVCPLEETVSYDSAPPSDRVDGFVVTSAQAVAALAKAYRGDERPCFAVGSATADALGAAGFPRVIAGRGKAETLAPVIGERFADRSGLASLLYAAGRNRSGALEAALDVTPVRLITWEVYDVVPRYPDRPEIDSLLEPPVEVALLLSQAQARAFAEIVHPALPEGSRLPRLLCLSERIADALPSSMQAEAQISAAPSLVSLFEQL